MLVAGLWLAMVLVMAPFVAQGAEIRPRVVDARTRQPIAGAAVLVQVRAPGAVDYELEREFETDKDGRVTLNIPVMPADTSVVIYKFGYVLWSNVLIFQPSIGKPIPGARIRLDEKRQDHDIPEEILLAPFPPDGWRPLHANYLRALVSADGHYGWRPRFWRAIQREIEEARKQCGKDCE